MIIESATYGVSGSIKAVLCAGGLLVIRVRVRVHVSILRLTRRWPSGHAALIEKLKLPLFWWVEALPNLFTSLTNDGDAGSAGRFRRDGDGAADPSAGPNTVAYHACSGKRAGVATDRRQKRSRVATAMDMCLGPDDRSFMFLSQSLGSGNKWTREQCTYFTAANPGASASTSHCTPLAN